MKTQSPENRSVYTACGTLHALAVQLLLEKAGFTVKLAPAGHAGKIAVLVNAESAAAALSLLQPELPHFEIRRMPAFL
ncbi:hypothetical protein EG834_09545 [bacterium]|nr:hypothetical protein [bacterium]